MIEADGQDGVHLLHVDGRRIPFRVDRSDRRRLRITVHPDPRLEVVAPNGSATEEVLRRVERRARWIAKQWRSFEAYLPSRPPHRYVSGETHYYLGRQHRLKVVVADRSSVKLLAGRLTVASADETHSAEVQRLLEAWFRQRARAVFERRTMLCIGGCRALRMSTPPGVSLRRMTKRWGSCSSAGSILLNPDLVRAPTHCIDYVIVHELCHLREHNHGPAFYRLLGACLPDWETRKRRLESQAWT